MHQNRVLTTVELRLRLHTHISRHQYKRGIKLTYNPVGAGRRCLLDYLRRDYFCFFSFESLLILYPIQLVETAVFTLPEGESCNHYKLPQLLHTRISTFKRELLLLNHTGSDHHKCGIITFKVSKILSCYSAWSTLLRDFFENR